MIKIQLDDKTKERLLSFALWCDEQTYIFRKPKYSSEKKNKKPLLLIFKVLFIVPAVFALTFFVFYNTINITRVFCGNEYDTVMTFNSSAEEVVEKSKFKLNEDDKLVLDFFSEDENRNSIFIAKQQNVLIYVDGELKKSVSVTGTVGDALDIAGIKLSDDDKINFSKSSIITSDIQIKIESAFTVTIVADAETKKVKTTSNTVENILKLNGINFDEDDEITPSVDEKISEKTKIVLKRVTLKNKTRTVKTTYETITEYSDEMYTDQSKIKTKGKDGKIKEYYTEKYIDGKLSDTTVYKTKVIKEKVDKVVVKGTKERPLNYVYGTRVFSELTPPFEIELDSTNRPTTYIKRITGTATAYCGGGITSTGAAAMPGRVAVNPKQIPYGTKMYIVSSDGKYCYGYSVASDTGGFARQGSATVDLYMHSYTDCIQFGRRSVDIYILEWG